MERLFFGFGRDRVVSIGNGGSAEGEAKVHGRACLFFWERELCRDPVSRAAHSSHEGKPAAIFSFCRGKLGRDGALGRNGPKHHGHWHTSCIIHLHDMSYDDNDTYDFSMSIHTRHEWN